MMNEFSGEILFTGSGGKCNVKAVYEQSEQDAGKYIVTINQETDDLYKIQEMNLYIKTDGCLNHVTSEESVLSLDSYGTGSLYVEDDKCKVEGIYKKIKL